MSRWRIQVTYACKCDEGYGLQCTKHSRFMLVHNCSCDVSYIHHKLHIEDPDSRYELYAPHCISDEERNALSDLLNRSPHIDESEEIDPEFFKQEPRDHTK